MFMRYHDNLKTKSNKRASAVIEYSFMILIFVVAVGWVLYYFKGAICGRWKESLEGCMAHGSHDGVGWLIGGDRRAVRCGSDTFSANSAVFLRLFPYCRRSAAMRFRFHARHTRVHSFWTWASPRARNWRNPSTDLMIPNTGSTLCLRGA